MEITELQLIEQHTYVIVTLSVTNFVGC